MSRPLASAVAALTAAATLATGGALAGTAAASPAHAGLGANSARACAYPPRPSLLTLSVTATRVRAGHRDLAFGGLFRSHCVVPRARIQIRVNGRTVATRRTDSRGLYTYGFRPRHTETLQAVYAGGRTAAPATSRRVRVHVVR